MAHWITNRADLRCNHANGRVRLEHQQSWVQVDGTPVLVSGDTVGRPIEGCPNAGPTIKPCTATVSVEEGLSDFITIDGVQICLATCSGLTDGTPPGSANYSVKAAGQSIIEEA